MLCLAGCGSGDGTGPTSDEPITVTPPPAGAHEARFNGCNVDAHDPRIPMRSLSHWLSSHQLAAFFVLTFLISWAVFIPAQLLWGEPGEVHALSLVGGFGPFVSAIIVTSAAGKGSLLRWLRRIFAWRIGLIWLVAGWVLMPVGVGLLDQGLYLSLGGEAVSGETTLLGYIIVVPIAALFLGGNEEPGWRGFALPAMLERQHPAVASVLLGMIWSAWHLPLLALPSDSSTAPHIVSFSVSVVGLSIIMTWLYSKSKMSVIPVMLFHQGTNLIENLFERPTDVLPGGEDWQIIRGIVYWTMALGLLLWTKGRLGFSTSEARHLSNPSS